MRWGRGARGCLRECKKSLLSFGVLRGEAGLGRGCGAVCAARRPCSCFVFGWPARGARWYHWGHGHRALIAPGSNYCRFERPLRRLALSARCSLHAEAGLSPLARSRFARIRVSCVGVRACRCAGGFGAVRGRRPRLSRPRPLAQAGGADAARGTVPDAVAVPLGAAPARVARAGQVRFPWAFGLSAVSFHLDIQNG